jgi:hypothetical protein
MTTPDPVAGDSLEDLRVAVAALPAGDDHHGSTEGDASADAERFEAVHEALVAVLADVDRT